jgi:hypothetical protein
MLMHTASYHAAHRSALHVKHFSFGRSHCPYYRLQTAMEIHVDLETLDLTILVQRVQVKAAQVSTSQRARS